MSDDTSLWAHRLPVLPVQGLADHRVMLRMDCNVPLDPQGRVMDNRRLREAVPAIHTLVNQGAAVIIISHMGRPKGVDPAESLAQVHHHLAELLGQPVFLAEDCVGAAAETVTQHLTGGDVALLENLRYHAGEMANDPAFAQALAQQADAYVNEAFSASHRAHASVVGVPQLLPLRYAGPALLQEITQAERVLAGTQRPAAALVGGAKVSDKIAVIQHLLPRIDLLIIGGGMAYTFIAAQGGQVGASLLERDHISTAQSILAEAERRGIRVLLPHDSVIAQQVDAQTPTQVVASGAIPEGWMGLDIGPQARSQVALALQGMKTVLWNGPMGVFELEPFSHGSRAVAQALAEVTQAGGFTLVGGGDSAAALEATGQTHAVSYVSTGGGAMLEFLEGQGLPGLQALVG